jgi:Zn-dependent peptidase ImmA (M78 family)
VCQVLEGRTTPVHCRGDEACAGEGRALEREANRLAVEFLVPDELVRERYDRMMTAMGATFGVSEETMGWRLFNIDLSARTLGKKR